MSARCCLRTTTLRSTSSLVALTIALIAGCERDDSAGGDSASAPPPEAASPRVPEKPDTTGMEPQVAAAIERAYDAVARQPDSAKTWRHLGAVLDAHDVMRGAISAYREALRLAPGDFRAAYDLAVARDLLDDGDPSVPAAYRDALALDPTYAPAHMRLGDALMTRGNTQAAADAYRAALRHDPTMLRARRSLGQVLLAEGDMEAAIAELETVATIAPNDGPTHAALAQAFTRLGSDDAARTAAVRATGRDTLLFGDRVRADVMALTTSTLSVTRRANRNLTAGRLGAAIEDFRLLVTYNGDNAAAHLGLGRALMAARRFGEAADAPREGVRLAPEGNAMRWTLGAALAQDDRLDDALAAFARADRDATETPAGRLNYGNALVASDRPEDAVTQYQRAIAIDDDYAIAHYALGRVLTDLGRSVEARGHLMRAAELDDRFRSP